MKSALHTLKQTRLLRALSLSSFGCASSLPACCSRGRAHNRHNRNRRWWCRAPPVWLKRLRKCTDTHTTPCHYRGRHCRRRRLLMTPRQYANIHIRDDAPPTLYLDGGRATTNTATSFSNYRGAFEVQEAMRNCVAALIVVGVVHENRIQHPFHQASL